VKKIRRDVFPRGFCILPPSRHESSNIKFFFRVLTLRDTPCVRSKRSGARLFFAMCFGVRRCKSICVVSGPDAWKSVMGAVFVGVERVVFGVGNFVGLGCWVAWVVCRFWR